MMIHDLVKIHLINAGYLPNYPYHLISDAEMCDAFFNENNISMSYFHNTYENVDIGEIVYVKNANGELMTDKNGNTIESTPYNELVKAIRYYINKLKYSTDEKYLLPDWVYSYMLGVVINKYSDKLDIHDLIYPLGVDNIDDDFTCEAAIACYKVSSKWLQQTQKKVYDKETGTIDLRPPTIFGEPHVVKSIRLDKMLPV